jgi:hypothetical protein
VNLTSHEASQDRGRLLGALGHIDVRIGVVADQHVSELDHPRRDVGVQVEGRDHRHIGTDDPAHGLQDVPVSIVIDLGDHGAVQGEEDPVERTFRHGPPQPIAKQPGQLLDRLRRHQTGRRRPDGEDWYEVEPLSRCSGDETAELGVGASGGLNDVLAKLDPGRREGRKIRLDRGEGTGFVRDLGRGNAKGHRL